MTTIAYKDGIIAYDGRVTVGTRIDYDDYQKCIEVKGVKFVLAGCNADASRLIEAFFGAKMRNVDACALAYDGETLWLVNHFDVEGLLKTRLMPERPYAIGSGSPYAFAAMDMGCDARQAVKAAMKRDSCTGGKIRTLTVTSPDK